MFLRQSQTKWDVITTVPCSTATGGDGCRQTLRPICAKTFDSAVWTPGWYPHWEQQGSCWASSLPPVNSFIAPSASVTFLGAIDTFPECLTTFNISPSWRSAEVSFSFHTNWSQLETRPDVGRRSELWTSAPSVSLCSCHSSPLSQARGGGWRGVEGEMPVSDLWTKPNKPGSYPMFSPQTLSPCLRAVYPTSDTLLQKTLASSTGLRNANLNLRAFFYRGRVRFTLSSQVLWVLRPFEAAQLDETDNTFLFRIPASCSRYHCCSYQCLQALKQTKPNIYGYKRKLDIVGD